MGRALWITHRRTATVLLVGWAAAGVWIGVLAVGASGFGPTSRPAFVADYDGRVLDDGLELLIVQSDGQTYATLARDPLLQRVEQSFRRPAEASYRAQRPLFAWMAWALSAGRSGWVPPALAVLSSFGAGLAAAGAGALLRRRGRSEWWGLVVLVLPGAPHTLAFLGPELLMLGFVLWGLAAWEEDRQPVAVALFCARVLTRESALLVAAGLALQLAVNRRLGAALRLTPIPLVLAAWLAVLRLRLGAWPWDASAGRLGPPLVGFLENVTARWTVQNAGVLLLYAVAVTGALLVARRDHLTLIVVVHVAFATLMGRYVWHEVLGHARVLLPMCVIAVIAVAGGLSLGHSGRLHSGDVVGDTAR